MWFLILLLELENFFVFAFEMRVLKWDQSIGDFVLMGNKTESRKTQERNDKVLKSRLLETHNFDNAPVRISYYEEKPIMITYANGTKITGIIGQIWSDLSEYLNFTLVLLRSKSDYFLKTTSQGQIIGLLSLLMNNNTDVIPNAMIFSANTEVSKCITPYWEDSLRIFIQPEYSSNESWIFEIFSLNVLIFVILMMVIFSVLGLMIEKFNNRLKSQKNNYTIQEHLFETFAAFCSQGSHQERQNKYKVFELSRRIFTWFLLLTVSSHLISLMTNIETKPPFNNLENLLFHTNYMLLTKDGSLSERKFSSATNKFTSKMINLLTLRVNRNNSSEEMYRKICESKHRKYAIIELLVKRYSNAIKTCKLEPTGDPIEKSWSTALVTGKYKYKRSFDIGIMKLREVGILSKSKASLNRKEVEVSDSNLAAIEFKHVYVLFIILLIGGIISTVILFGENVYFYCQRRKNKIKLKRSKKRFKKAKRNLAA